MQTSVKAVVGCLLIFTFQSMAWGQATQQNRQQGDRGQVGQQQNNLQPASGQTNLQNQRGTAQNAGIQEVNPQMPQGFPLDAESKQWVSQLLNHWESTSDQVKSYRCEFLRWHYMPSVLNYRDPNTHKLAARMVTKGHIRFAKPDQGRYDVEEVWHFNAPAQEGAEPVFDLNPDTQARELEKERWICDGKGIYEFDFANKRLNEMKLPPEMQGAGLKNSPLPFVFGAKADDLKSRFWIRPMVPEGLPEGHYMIEAYPKTSRDSRAYSKVQIVLSSEPFLPVRVELFASNYDAKENPESMVLVFENRKINDPRDLIQKAISEWFSRPMTPVGWEFSSIDLANEETDRSAQQNSNIK